jgi:hypothetical protein
MKPDVIGYHTRRYVEHEHQNNEWLDGMEKYAVLK